MKVGDGKKKHLADLQEALVENRVGITPPPRSIKGVPLTPEEYSEFSRLAGQHFVDGMDKLLRKRGYIKGSIGPEGERGTRIMDTLQKARETARHEMIKFYPELKERIMVEELRKKKARKGE